MKYLLVNIYQGNDLSLEKAYINIVIDVIRAFTVSYYAFKSKVKDIYLVNDTVEALKLKDNVKGSVLSGEINGYKIESFDYGNSPYDIYRSDLSNKTLIQKTSNGTKATFCAMNADYTFVTGFVNYLSLVKVVKKLISNYKDNKCIINIIASHKTGDDDLACAQLIKEAILSENINYKTWEENTIYRIVNSKSARKFFDEKNKDFTILDISLVINLTIDDFVMRAKHIGNVIKLDKYKV